VRSLSISIRRNDRPTAARSACNRPANSTRGSASLSTSPPDT
jgi:hypothetical protein